ncbi:MAG: hypothetical protein J07HN4v3_02474 [Halonotius sp. J07HN4]|jgi:hypothetical protein|nr:MAG: hypothetical protein J07HN4v3_02474 [Halonotius sp. J07HN4]
MQTEEADHLAELSDGAGCTEIWEHLSERRESEEADNAATADADDTASNEE